MNLLKRVLGRRPETQGDLEYFGLGQWWLSRFSEAEREYIEQAYRPAGSPAGSRPLTSGEVSSIAHTASGLLTALAGWFREKPEDRSIALRMLAKAEERALAENDILGHHFVYQEMIRLHYTWRDRFPDALDSAFAACYKQMTIAPEVAKAFHDKYPQEPLPTHAGYEQSAVILEKQGDYGRAIKLCKQAASQGWPGNWTWRIRRMTKKLGYPVTCISPAGMTRIRL